MCFPSPRDCKKKFGVFFFCLFPFYLLYVYLGMRSETSEMPEASAKTQTNTKQKIQLLYYRFALLLLYRVCYTLCDCDCYRSWGREGCAIRENERRRRLTPGYFDNGHCRRRCEGGGGRGCGGAAGLGSPRHRCTGCYLLCVSIAWSLGAKEHGSLYPHPLRLIAVR